MLNLNNAKCVWQLVRDTNYEFFLSYKKLLHVYHLLHKAFDDEDRTKKNPSDVSQN